MHLERNQMETAPDDSAKHLIESQLFLFFLFIHSTKGSSWLVTLKTIIEKKKKKTNEYWNE